MERAKLLLMANQIASYFGAYPEADAVKGIAEHLTAFWTPGMRHTLAGELTMDPHGAHRLVLLALPAAAMQNEERLPGESPIKKVLKGPDALGGLASDAG